MERKKDTGREGGGVMLRINTVGEMFGGSSSLGSNPVVNAVVDAVDGISVLVVTATGTQIATEMKSKAASNEAFMVFFFFSFSFLRESADDIVMGERGNVISLI